MKKLMFFLCPIALIVGCSKKSEVTVNFLNCELATVEATGAVTWTDNYTYDNAGNKTQLARTQSGGNYNETYEYDNNKISKVTNTYGTIDLTYSSGKLTKVVHKDLSGNLTYTEDVTYASNVITYTAKDPGSIVIQTDEYTLSGQDVAKEVYKEYTGSTLTYKGEFVFSNFDTYYNPEYLSDAVIFPASIHNYNLVNITNTDFSSGTPQITTYSLTYLVTGNKSKAVAYRKRTRNDNGEILIRTYTYNKCQ